MKYLQFIILAIAVTICTQLPLHGQINNLRQVEQSWQTDTTRRQVALGELAALLQRNQIQPIAEPQYVRQSRKNASDEQPVIAIEYSGQARAYPLAVLSYHEIVNDRLGDTLFSITYCPLCNSALVFNRQVTHQGQSYTLTFGTSGMLRKSNLVMWDEETESWWQQFTGKALVGELAGAELEVLPSQLISLADFWESWPEGQVLEPQTGWLESDKAYNKNPYPQYDSPENTKPRLLFEAPSKRLPPMTRVIDLHHQGVRKIYPLSIIQQKQVINDTLASQAFVIFADSSMQSNLDAPIIDQSKTIGSATAYVAENQGRSLTFTATANGYRDNQTGSLWSYAGVCIRGPLKGRSLTKALHGHHFAFAWLAFYPNSLIYSSGN